MFTSLQIWRRNLDLNQLRQTGNTLVKLRTRFGNHDDRVLAINKSQITKPVVTNAYSLSIHVIQARNRRVRQQHVRPFY